MFDNHINRQRLRLTDIARRAGVSVATVSNAINRKGRMSKETLEKIFAIVAELEAESSIEKNASAGSIVFGSVDTTIKVHHSYLHMCLFDGMRSVLDEIGWTLKMADFDSPEHFHKQAGQYSAAVLVGFPGDPEAWSENSPIPLVWALRATGRSADVVQEDNREIARLAAEYLLERGHTHVGYIDDSHIESLGERGWHLGAFLERGGGRLCTAAGENLFTTGPDNLTIDQQQVAELIKELLNLTPRPTALFIPGDRLCIAVYAILAEMGVKPQEDIAVLSCNNEMPFLTAMVPRPATIGMNAEAIGRRAAETALWRLDHPGEPPLRILVRPELVLPPW